MRLRRWGAGLAAAAVVLAGAAVTRIAVADSTPASAAAKRSAQRTVTLVTGDRVTVSGDGGYVSAEPGPGRDGVTFAVMTAKGGLRVVPSDAAPLLAAGRVDERLFDVTGLVAAGYDRADHLPLITTGSAAAVAGLSKDRDLPSVHGAAVRQPRDKAAQSWRALRSSTGKIWLDGTFRPTLDVSVPQIGAPEAWQAGYTGTGVTVAVLDTGIDDTHPDLAGQVLARHNFTDGAEPDGDLSGHGTHVASTIAGTGAASGGKYKGVAPGARLLDGKVCAVFGCLESWIIAGMTWAAAEQHAKVVSMSLGGEDDPAVVDPVEEAVRTLSDQYGTLFVIAAGNTDGAVVYGGVESPGTAEAALTVGAVDDKDALADFSRRGPTGDERMKPDITAPGVGITAARGKDAGEVPGTAGDPYTTLSGTSMATPHVAGAAAILAQRHTDWPGPRLKAALMASARLNPAYNAYDQGAGRVDVARAIGQTVTGTPVAVGFGEQAWPHDDDKVLTREVTYHNDGSAAVTLGLGLAVTGPDGTPVPAGEFTVTPASLVVPAGGDATATVAADTTAGGPDGRLGGWLTATGGDVVVRTPVGVNKEVESYDVTLRYIGRDGGTPAASLTQVTDRNSPVLTQWNSLGQDGSKVLRLPKGQYTVISDVMTATTVAGPDGKPTMEHAFLAQPALDVDRSMTVMLDARLGKPVSVTVARPDARQVFAELAAVTVRPGGTASVTLVSSSYANIYTAQIGPDVAVDGFLSTVSGQWARAAADGGTDDSPYFYSLYFPENGRMIDGYQRSVADRDLAKVRADFAATYPGEVGVKRIAADLAGPGGGGFGSRMSFHLPFSRTEYYSSGPGIGWTGDLSTDADGKGITYVLGSTPTAYQPGHPYVERWNTGVFAPYLDPTEREWQGVSRSGDDLMLDMPGYSDGTGRGGWGATTTSTATLFRDGTKIGGTEWNRFNSLAMPAEDATYRLELHAERGAPFALSTRADIAWTFRSHRGETGTTTRLPVWTVRFAPQVDRFNAVPAGAVQAVPVTVTPQPGAVVGDLSGLTVEASFDDGATWRRAAVKNGAALVPHPAGSGFVSLRAKASDSAGNTVEQTVIHAYRYGIAGERQRTDGAG